MDSQRDTKRIDMEKWIDSLEQSRTLGFPECHSIHCRHYDLGTGKPCVVEAARVIYAKRVSLGQSDKPAHQATVLP